MALVNNEEIDPLQRVCELLNRYGAKYMVVGGHACILHGLVRTTSDVDILVENSRENFQKVIDALSELEDGAAKELTPQDFEENVVIKIADEVEVDVSKSAWKVTYDHASQEVQHISIDGVDIPFISLRDLIASKQTFREQDQADLINLNHLYRNKPTTLSS